MALTFRSNGTAGGLVSASWWNDYYNLFTGVMTDQAVTIGNALTLQTANATLTIKNGSGSTVFSVDNSGNTTVNKINFPGSTTLSRISHFSGTGSGAAQTISHGLGTTPDAVMLTYAGNFGGPPTNSPYWYNGTSTTVTVVAQSGYFYHGIAIKF